MWLLLVGGPLTAQPSPFADAKNLQVLPAEISPRELGQTMKGFTRALGVRCTHCHVGVEGEPLSSYDFASDDKAPKRVARNMLQMVDQLNAQLLPTALAEDGPAEVRVECMTCHRGHARPVLIEDQLRQVAAEGGLSAALAHYRDLRAKHYGGQGLDFGDQPLIALAESSFAAGDQAQSRSWLDLALEYNASCETCLFYRARQLAAAGETAAAIADLQALLAIRPDAPPVQAMLQSLQAKLEGGEAK